LASITTERNHSEGVDVIDSINIELVKENIALLDNICLDNYYEVPRDKLETLAIENAREAISYYEKWCREHPNFRHNSP
jgi:hypothetical protein